MNEQNILRELDKIDIALDWCDKHLKSSAEANAALHTSERVMYSPLSNSVFSAINAAKSIRNEFE